MNNETGIALAIIGSICTVVGVITSIISVVNSRKLSPLELHTRLKTAEDCVQEHEKRLSKLESNLRTDIKGVYTKIDELIMTLLGKKL